MRFSLLAFPALAAGWNLTQFTDLVVFGNSYADESRWNYFASHNGSAPPVGWTEPVVCPLPYPSKIRIQADKLEQ